MQSENKKDFVIVTVDHVRKAKICAKRGVIYARELGIDVKKLCNSGIPSYELEHIDNFYVKKILEIAWAEEAKQQ